MLTMIKQDNAQDLRKLYIEGLVAKRMAQTEVINDVRENWNQQKREYEKIASLEDLRKLEGRQYITGVHTHENFIKRGKVKNHSG